MGFPGVARWWACFETLESHGRPTCPPFHAGLVGWLHTCTKPCGRPEQQPSAWQPAWPGQYWQCRDGRLLWYHSTYLYHNSSQYVNPLDLAFCLDPSSSWPSLVADWTHLPTCQPASLSPIYHEHVVSTMMRNSATAPKIADVPGGCFGGSGRRHAQAADLLGGFGRPRHHTSRGARQLCIFRFLSFSPFPSTSGCVSTLFLFIPLGLRS